MCQSSPAYFTKLAVFSHIQYTLSNILKAFYTILIYVSKDLKTAGGWSAGEIICFSHREDLILVSTCSLHTILFLTFSHTDNPVRLPVCVKETAANHCSEGKRKNDRWHVF